MISNDVTPLESYSSICKEYVDYRRALLRITNQQCKSLRYEEIAKFVDLPLQDFMDRISKNIIIGFCILLIMPLVVLIVLHSVNLYHCYQHKKHIAQCRPARMQMPSISKNKAPDVPALYFLFRKYFLLGLGYREGDRLLDQIQHQDQQRYQCRALHKRLAFQLRDHHG